MIPRYSREAMASIWSDAAKYQIWLDIETHVCAAQAELGVIPASVAAALANCGALDTARIAELEADCKHDVIAFLTHVAELVGEESRFVHQGLTSSDVLDTCLSVQLVRSADILLSGLEDLLAALRERAYEHKLTPVMGRSHGMHAEPMSFGVKLAGHYGEFRRGYERLRAAREEVRVCAVSGAVGNFTHIDPRVEAYVAEKLGLRVDALSTQVIARDRHALFCCVLAVLAGSLERLAVTVRLLQSTEVGEAEEYFAPLQKGSSAMPHKRNPILSENLVGLARMIRAAALPALENIALWHERDISHSSVERQLFPDVMVLVDFALARATSLVRGLQVHAHIMTANMARSGGLYNSQRLLLALTQRGVAREEAYLWVQRNAMRAFHGEDDFRTLIDADADIGCHLQSSEIADIFKSDYYLRHVDTLFARVFDSD